jgi:hypothetical protein
MRLLATDNIILKDLRPRIRWALSVLPIGLMFASLVALIKIAMWSSALLGIGRGAVNSQPNGLLWLVLFMSAMLVLMLSAYALGWLINALIAKVYFGWTAEQIRNVFLESKVPDAWRNDGISSESRRAGSWAVTRLMGPWRYVLLTGVLRWGGGLFFGTAVIPVLLHRRNVSSDALALQAVVWGVAGALFGLLMWIRGERQYRQLSATDNPQAPTLQPTAEPYFVLPALAALLIALLLSIPYLVTHLDRQRHIPFFQATSNAST